MATSSYPASRRTFLRASGLGLASITAAGCAAAPEIGEAAFSPAVGDWFSQLGQQIGAAVVSNLVTDGLDAAWRAWKPGVIQAIHSQTSSSYQQRSPAGWLVRRPSEAASAVAFCTSLGESPDPRSDRLVTCVGQGRETVVFEAWAWQALDFRA